MPCGFKSRPWYHDMDGTGHIGVFDSGFGGLDVFGAITRHLPQFSYIYLADSARAPYGSRSKEEVLAYTTEAVEFLFARGARLVILACNTASSDALRTLQMGLIREKYPDRNILGVLIPASEEAVRVSRSGRIGVIGTEQTIASGSFDREVRKLLPSASLFTQACPRLVPLIESGAHDSPELAEALAEYLKPLIQQNIDTLILGCTHYGLIEERIRVIVGPEVEVVRESRVVPSELEQYLKRHPACASQLSTDSALSFYTTGPTDHFERLGTGFFGRKIQAERISLP